MEALPTASFADKPTLTGELVTLRPFVDGDLTSLGAAIGDAEVARLTGSVNTSDQAGQAPDEEVLARWYGTRNEQADRLDLAVVDNSTGVAVGEVVLNEWEAANACCNFRVLIGPAGRDRGLGTEATRLMLQHAFESLRLHRVGLEVYAFNPRALRTYEKVGFVREGVRRDALRFDGQWVDSVLMAVLAPEWAGHRGRPGSQRPTV